MKSISTTCFLLSLSLGLFAQQWETITPMANISHTTALNDAGLAGTSGAGLVYWDMPDGRTHINTSNSAIPGDTIGRLAIAPNGHWWIQTEAGIGQFDGSNWFNWSLATIGLPANTLINNIRISPDASVYVLTNDGFARFNSGVWTVQNMANSGLPNNQLTDVAFAPDGKIFFGSRSSGILLLDNGNWTVYNSAATGVTNMNAILGLTFDPDGILWAFGGTLSVRLVRFDGNTWTGFTAAAIGITGSTTFFRAIVSDPHGVWLAHSRGLSHLQAGNWTHYTSEDIGCLPLTNTSISLDGTGHAWFLSTCGLLRFNGQAWNYVDTGLPGSCGGFKLEAVAEGADGSLWLGTTESDGGCITRTDGIHWEHYNPLELGASTLNVNTIFTDRQGRTWFGMDGELLLYDQGEWTLLDTFAQAFADHWIRTIADSPGGDIWLALVPLPSGSQQFAAIARYSNEAWSFWTSMEVPNLQGIITALESNEDGVLWASVLGKGLLRFDGSTWTLFNASNSGLPNNDIFDITTAPDGVLWLATDAGLVSYNGQQWTVTNTSNSGLPADRLRKLAFDLAGGLYVGYLPSVAGHITAVLRDGQWTEISPPSAPSFSGFSPISAMIVDSRNRMIFTTSEFLENYYIYDPMVVGVAEALQPRSNWSVFPNPGAGSFYLRSAALSETGYVNLYDLHGRRLMRMPLQSAETPYQLKSLPAGVYVIEVLVSGERKETLRWINH